MSAKFSNLSNEALLLMYIAGELDKSTTREVEARLAQEEDLRDTLQALRGLDADLSKFASDESGRPLSRYDSSLRKSLAMMRQHSLTSPLPRHITKNRSRVPAWIWRAAVAALLIVGVTMMLSRQSSKEIALEEPHLTTIAVATQPTEDDNEYAKLYDMFDAPIGERAAEDPILQDLAVLTQLSQMLQ